jgi:hypothetical protein
MSADGADYRVAHRLFLLLSLLSLSLHNSTQALILWATHSHGKKSRRGDASTYVFLPPTPATAFSDACALSSEFFFFFSFLAFHHSFRFSPPIPPPPDSLRANTGRPVQIVAAKADSRSPNRGAQKVACAEQGGKKGKLSAAPVLHGARGKVANFLTTHTSGLAFPSADAPRQGIEWQRAKPSGAHHPCLGQLVRWPEGSGREGRAAGGGCMWGADGRTRCV